VWRTRTPFLVRHSCILDWLESIKTRNRLGFASDELLDSCVFGSNRPRTDQQHQDPNTHESSSSPEANPTSGLHRSDWSRAPVRPV
jgi:hypothetical protein